MRLLCWLGWHSWRDRHIIPVGGPRADQQRCRRCCLKRWTKPTLTRLVAGSNDDPNDEDGRLLR